jgi:predicted DNA-binding protein (MmcQ/YjbR family)
MPIRPADKLRAICLALPGATETVMKRGPTYRIGDKIFAWDRQWGGAATVWLKVPEGVQAVLVGADSRRFFVPPYVGKKGWVGMRLSDRPDWKEVEALVTRSYRLIAPRRSGAACN